MKMEILINRAEFKAKNGNSPIFSVMWRVLYHIPLIGMFLPSTSWFLQHNRWFITWHLCTSLIFYVGGLILLLVQHAT